MPSEIEGRGGRGGAQSIFTPWTIIFSNISKNMVGSMFRGDRKNIEFVYLRSHRCAFTLESYFSDLLMHWELDSPGSSTVMGTNLNSQWQRDESPHALCT